MQKLESILVSSFPSLALRERISWDFLRRSWHTVCGEPLSLHTFPADLRGGVLTVNVDSSLWLQQVKFLREELKERLREFQVTEVRYRLGRVTQKNRHHTGVKDVTRGCTPEELSGADKDWLEVTLSSVKDENLRDLLRKTIAGAILKGSRNRR